MEIKKFTFWKSWKDQAGLLSDEDRLAFYDAIVAYAFDGTIPSMSNVSPMVYGFVIGAIPFLDTNISNSLNGAKGGRPKKSNNPPFNPPKKAEEEIGKGIELEFGEGNEEEGEGEVSPSAPSKNSRFIPPSESEVADWLFEEKDVDAKEARRIAQRFVSFYESKGWMVGRNKMKSWKAAIAGWLARDRQSAEAAQERAQGMNAAQNMAQYQYRAAESPQTHENGLGIVQMPEAMIQH